MKQPKGPTRKRWAYAALGSVAVSVGLIGCGGGGSSPAEEPPVASDILTPTASCTAFVGQTIPASAIGVPSGVAVIRTATLQAPTTPTNQTFTGPGPAGGTRTTLVTPEHCKVVGAIKPVDTSAPDINFQVNLPSKWNQRAAQLGGGGMNGNIPGALNDYFNAPQMQPAGVGSPIQRGFMDMGSDSGHTSEPNWTANAEAAENLAHLQMKKTKDVAVWLAKAYYGSGPKFVYFMGSSQGGREALIVAQKYPNDYDGVFSNVPIIGFTGIAVYPTLLAQRQTGAGWLPNTKTPTIAAEVMRQCDALDGVVDGVASDYMTCNARFVDLPASAPSPWTNIRCATGLDEGNTCLSDAQITTLRSIHTLYELGGPLAFGAPGWSAWGVGAEAPGWLTSGTQPTRANWSGGTGGGWMRGVIMGDMSARSLDFDPVLHRAGILRSSLMADATNPNLEPFRARGGKLLLKHNTGDYTANPREAMRYYEQVVSTMGQASVDSFMRFYIAPGQLHTMNNNPKHISATGEEIPSQYDILGLLDAWVTKNETPGDSLMLESRQLAEPFTVYATRPICRYPAYPRYTGGDRTVGTNYVCTRP